MNELYRDELNNLSHALLKSIHFRVAVGIALFVVSFVFCAGAFVLHQASLFVLAGCALLLLMGIDFAMIRTIYGYYFRATTILTDKAGVTEANQFDMSMIFVTFVKLKEIHAISMIEERAARHRALRRLPYIIRTFMGFSAPLITLVVEICLMLHYLGQPGWAF